MPTKPKCDLNVVRADYDAGVPWSQIAEKYGYTDPRYLRKAARRLGWERRYHAFTREQLAVHLESGLSPDQIGELYGLTGGGIRFHLRKMGIRYIGGSKNFAPRNRPIGSEHLAFVAGSVLGDGNLYIDHTSVNACLRIAHGAPQKEYLMWKASFLGDLVAGKAHERHHKDGSVSYYFRTVNHPDLARIRTDCYRDGRKAVTESLLSLLTPLSIAIWYMDDGWRADRDRQVGLATCSFTSDDHDRLIQWFHRHLGIEPYRQSMRNAKYNKSYWHLMFGVAQSARFLEFVRPYMHPSMAYKLGD